MTQAEIEKILKASGPEDQLKLKVLYNAVIKGIQDYNAEPTAAKLRDWKSAEKELEEFARELNEKQNPSERTFRNLQSVLTYLTESGYKISQSKIYQDRDEGKIRPQKNGNYTLKAVEKYASLFAKRLDGSTSGDDEQLQKERLQAETKKAKAQAKHWEQKTKIAAGQYVPKESFERELAARASIFKTDLENFCRSEAVGIISIVTGDQNKAPDLIDRMLTRVEHFLNRYSDGAQFKAMIEIPDDQNDDADEDENDDDY